MPEYWAAISGILRVVPIRPALSASVAPPIHPAALDASGQSVAPTIHAPARNRHWADPLGLPGQRPQDRAADAWRSDGGVPTPTGQ
jgi:hypothetical protein